MVEPSTINALAVWFSAPDPEEYIDQGTKLFFADPTEGPIDIIRSRDPFDMGELSKFVSCPEFYNGVGDVDGKEDRK
ncbi:hypothetical protein HL657_07940 [Methanoculleus sp. YWC-01]|uniref:Uncharacterized protein n=1 Tax=Methanoculleus nereidis TaxID=2735141 RepID=A0ABU3Z2Q9_9EURY|nr:hypothetical protein [Methanoculleus sp. YWC-01]MDV4343097.1 hypothetical protein [Methanoculleus sp. YWC-01]